MSDTATSQLVQLDARIGVDVSESQSLADIITQAGFDFDVEKVPVYNPEGEEVNGQFIIRRADTRQNFAVMRKRYTPIPMKAGDLLIFSYLTVHGSTPNTCGQWRRMLLFSLRSPLDNRKSEPKGSVGQGLIVRGVHPNPVPKPEESY